MRDIPIGNGSFLLNFDEKYQIRDIYFPHVGQENHTEGYPFRFGVWTAGKFSWVSSDEWKRKLEYHSNTLATKVELENERLGVFIKATDTVLPDQNVFLRKLVIQSQQPLRIFLHHDFRIFSNKIGDCAFYDPEAKAIVHYKRDRYFLIGSLPKFDKFAIGRKAFRNLEGTWRDAEDGELQICAIAEGSVDSTVQINLSGEAEVYYWICAGKSHREVLHLNNFVEVEGPENLIEKSKSFWTVWLENGGIEFCDLEPEIVELYNRSLLIIRTNIDNDGAILAANDSDVVERATDHYSYLWTRDGAFVAYALDLAGYPSLSRKFFAFCAEIVHEQGYFLQKYNPDGTVASSWQPLWDTQLKCRLTPIQEDETALVLWSLWKHYEKYHDTEFIREIYRPLIVKCADFMANYSNEKMKLPKSSWNLWEDRRGIHTFTVASVIAGLRSAARFASLFGDYRKAIKYEQVAENFKQGLLEHLYCPERRRFLRSLETYDDINFTADDKLDASLFSLFYFEIFPPEDEKIKNTMQAIEEKLWIQKEKGGLARYENDSYMKVSDDITGNPWIICTLWLADYYVALAKTKEELEKAKKIIRLVTEWTLASGVLSEQVDPFDGKQVSVAPLTWSHSSFVAAVCHYVQKAKTLKASLSEKVLS